MTPAYQEIVEFIAAGATSHQVASFCPSERAKARVAELIGHEKTNGLSPEEKAELDHYLELEHLMRMAKARACSYIGHE